MKQRHRTAEDQSAHGNCLGRRLRRDTHLNGQLHLGFPCPLIERRAHIARRNHGVECKLAIVHDNWLLYYTDK
jgi:hypothetical protein